MANQSKKVLARCRELDENLVIELDIKDFRLLKKIREDYPFAELNIKTQNGYPVMIERVVIKDSLTDK